MSRNFDAMERAWENIQENNYQDLIADDSEEEFFDIPDDDPVYGWDD